MNRLIYLFLVMILAGCKTANRYDLEQQISLHGLTKQYVSANQFDIMYLSNQKQGQTLHIYLEGDGLPWVSRYLVSKDPTPRKPLALALMTQDISNAIYLSRPCYNLLKLNSVCEPSLWTNARYSPTVVNAMLEAIGQIIAAKQVNNNVQISNVVLIGYSGGGVLASLLAEELTLASSYVTVAANLDTKRWTEHHQYSPLVGSINPMDVNRQNYKPGLHFVGGVDQIVPPKTSQHFIEKTKGTQVILKSNGHDCCWVEQWPQLLIEIERFSQ